MNHVMLDLETMGTSNRAAILSIGAVRFDPDTGLLGDRFYEAIDPEDAAAHGIVDQHTLDWWQRQSQEAQDAAFCGTKKLVTVLDEFKDYYLRSGSGFQTPIWGNGATFDITIMENAYLITGQKIPWEFRSPRDVRTIVDVCRSFVNKPDFVTEGVAHNALDDAVHQAKFISEMWRAIKFGLSTSGHTPL